MIPGMTVVVDIIGKKRSILNYILTPLERASGVVFREK
jgi:multidrug efflux pump subunit AcrA (membrane-fusion protein)